MAWAWVPEGDGADSNLEHIEDPPENFSEQDFWRWVQERTDWNIFSGSNNPLANSRAVAAHTKWTSMGTGFYYDVHPSQRNHALRFDTYLALPQEDGQLIHTSSAAKSFFALPPAVRPTLLESGPSPQHLFHPYWQAALATPSLSGVLP